MHSIAIQGFDAKHQGSGCKEPLFWETKVVGKSWKIFIQVHDFLCLLVLNMQAPSKHPANTTNLLESSQVCQKIPELFACICLVQLAQDQVPRRDPLPCQVQIILSLEMQELQLDGLYFAHITI
jgi:hypothetical protein